MDYRDLKRLYSMLTLAKKRVIWGFEVCVGNGKENGTCTLGYEAKVTTVEIQMEKKVDNKMETGLARGVKGT